MNNELLKPKALPPVRVKVPSDEWDNIIREWGVGYACEWFGHGYDGEFAKETVDVLQARYAASMGVDE